MLIDSSTACIANGQTWFSLISFQSLLLTTFSPVPDDLVLYLRRNIKTTWHDFLRVFPPLMQKAPCRVPPSLGGKAFFSVSSNSPTLSIPISLSISKVKSLILKYFQCSSSNDCFPFYLATRSSFFHIACFYISQLPFSLWRFFSFMCLLNSWIMNPHPCCFCKAPAYFTIK